METHTSTLEAPAAGAPQGAPTQPKGTDKKASDKKVPGRPTGFKTLDKPSEKTQAAAVEKPAGPEKVINTPENQEKLRLILRREKEDPNVKFSDAELDLLDQHYAGKIQPAKRTKAAVSHVKEETDTPADDKPAEEEAPPSEEEDGEEAPETDEDEEEEAPGDEPDADAAALMKEVGAKSLKEAVAKVKELRSKLGGKDAQAVAQLQRQVANEKALWEDVAKGVPAALAHAEKVYGIKIASGPAPASTSAAPASTGAASGGPPSSGRTYIDENLFIDPESAKIANEAFRARDAELDGLKSQLKEVLDERDRNRKDTAMTQAKMAVVDEMVTVAQRMDALKAIPNLREAIAAWYDKGTPDARLEVFNELFQIAEKEGCSLIAAATIKRGLDADRLVAEAEERGRKAAYGHKPNPSLSGSQGGRNEQGNYTPITQAQIEAMAEDHTLMPKDWFDDKDNPVQSKIPRKAWPLFGFT